jgi:ABC-type multidrug transport system permease subunit
VLTGFLNHTLFTLKLNFRSKQAIIYGFFVPIFFLVAFGALFRWTKPPLLAQMGGLLTISALGGSCFGMPTGMVSDREKGVWRRYRLLPASTAGLVVSTMIARFVLVASAGVLQIILAVAIYKTPLPLHPIQLLIAFTLVAFSFEAMGLVIAAAADNVPAVQALGMAIFLPMIIIGGVGVPLAQLPIWAQKFSGFLPGRYAVEMLQPCFDQAIAMDGHWFSTVALLVIGIAGCIAGAKLFRWDANQQFRNSAKGWALLAFASWIAVGIAASATGRLKPIVSVTVHPTPRVTHGPWDKITDDQINSLKFDGLPPDDGTVAPVAKSATDIAVPEVKDRVAKVIEKLASWPLGHNGDDAQRVRNYLSAASIADASEDTDFEGPMARAVFDRLRADFDQTELIHILAYIAIDPDQGTVLEDAPELDVHGPINPDTIRTRNVMYALKLLGRLLGKLPE